jgi:hypothetical protein
MTRNEAEDFIKKILRQEAQLARSVHFWEQAGLRRYTMQDVRRILRSHKMEGRPVNDEVHGNYVVRLRGTSVDGRPTRLILGIREVGPSNLISIIDLTRTRR